jgi:phosphatidylethanolamine-binding protein (PEBP) family uncharacterized protein
MKKTFLALCLASSGSSVQAAGFTLESPEIRPNGTIRNEQVFDGFGCTGGNISPALEWKNAPKETRSFAVLVHDPDAPTGGSGWWHWVVINLPAETTRLALGAGKADGSGLPAGATQISTDFGGPGWGGPVHRSATDPTATTSPCMPSRSTSWNCHRALPPPWPAS